MATKTVCATPAEQRTMLRHSASALAREAKTDRRTAMAAMTREPVHPLSLNVLLAAAARLGASAAATTPRAQRVA